MPTLEEIIQAELERQRQDQGASIPWEQFGGGTGEYTGPGSSVLKILSYFDRPRNALASLVQAMQKGQNPLSAGWEGLTGDRQTSWGDVFGIPQAQSSMGWGDYLKYGGGRLALDMLLDPLNLIPIARAGKLGETASKLTHMPAGVGDALAGTSFGKYFGHQFGPESKWFPLSLAEQQAGRETGPLARNVIEQNQILAEKMAAAGVKPANVTRYLEEGRNPEILGLGKNIPEDLLQAIEAAHGGRAETFTALQAARERAGMEIPQAIQPFTIGETTREYAPHIESEAGKWARLGQPEMGGTTGAGGRKWIGIDPTQPYHAELVRLTDAEGNLLPTVTKLTDEGLERSGIKLLENGTMVLKKTGEPVKFVKASLNDIYETGALKAGHFLDNPALANIAKANENLSKTNYANLVTQMKGQTFKEGAQDIPLLMDKQQAMAARLANPNLFAENSWITGPRIREVRIRGLQGFEAPAAVANRLENLAYLHDNPQAWLGGIERGMDYIFNKTRLGTAFRDYTNFWRRNMLGMFPGYYVANVVSNMQLIAQQGGPEALLKTAAGWKMGSLRSAENLSPTLEKIGISGKQLFESALDRDVVSKPGQWQGWIKDLAGDVAAKGREPAPWLSGLAEKTADIPVAGPVFKGVKSAGEAWWKVNTTFFELFGRRPEDSARATLYLHFLEKYAPEIKSGGLTFEQAADKAAIMAKQGVFDYGDLTPMEQALRNIVPFYTFTRKIIGKTLEDAGIKPQFFSQFNRLLNFTFTPLTDAQKEQADWLAGQAPVTGIMGAGAQTATGRPAMGLLGRFLAQGNLEQAAWSPANFLGSMINPAIREPFEQAYNYSSYFHQPIDKYAQGPFGGLTAPITGEPYQLGTRTQVGKQMPAGLEHLLMATPASRYLQNILDPVLKGTGISTPPGREESSTPLAQSAYFATGGKVYDYDELKYATRAQNKESRQEAQLKRDATWALHRGDIVNYLHLQDQLQKHQENRRRGAASPVPM